MVVSAAVSPMLVDVAARSVNQATIILSRPMLTDVQTVGVMFVEPAKETCLVMLPRVTASVKPMSGVSLLCDVDPTLFGIFLLNVLYFS